MDFYPMQLVDIQDSGDSKIDIYIYINKSIYFLLATIPCQRAASLSYGFYEHFMPRATTSAHGCELQVNDL